MIDIHSHLLPGVDDGSRSLAQSVGVLKLLADAGITDIVVTPHLRAGEIAARGEAAILVRDERLAELKAAAPPGIRLHAGFEIMLDRPLPPEALGDRRYALAGSRYYLVEFPLSVMGHLVADVLQVISAKGWSRSWRTRSATTCARPGPWICGARWERRSRWTPPR